MSDIMQEQKMGPIKERPGISQNLKKLDKQSDTHKIDSNKGSDVSKSILSTSKSEKAEISDAECTLLNAKTESVRFIDQIENTRTLSESELQDIRDKVNSGYYFDQKVVEKIAELLLGLPYFLDSSDNCHINIRNN